MLVVDDKLTAGWVECLRKIDDQYPYRKKCFYKALSKIEHDKFSELKLGFDDWNVAHIPTNVHVLAPGFCVFLPWWLANNGTSKMFLYDYDKEVQILNGDLIYKLPIEFELRTLDIIFDTEHIKTDRIDTVINQSCENMWHMKSVIGSYDPRTLFIFQSTTEHDRGRINVPKSMDEFIESTGLKSVIYTNKANNILTVIGRQ